jgi:hypothetical protein
VQRFGDVSFLKRDLQSVGVDRFQVIRLGRWRITVLRPAGREEPRQWKQ